MNASSAGSPPSPNQVWENSHHFSPLSAVSSPGECYLTDTWDGEAVAMAVTITDKSSFMPRKISGIFVPARGEIGEAAN
jgi:hypothetical protein